MAIFDVGGRQVRTLPVPDRFEPGLHSILWDGRDDAGAAVASGLYLVRAGRSADGQVRRITIVR